MNWNKRIWSRRELTLLLGLVFIVIPVLIELRLRWQLWLKSW
ncbi:hypothetical protein ABEP17_19465 [Priestia flexa]|nr:hypothetical protein [Priestia flexa]